MQEKRHIVSPAHALTCISSLILTHFNIRGLLKFKEKSGCTSHNVSPYRKPEAISTTLFFYFTQQTFLLQ